MIRVTKFICLVLFVGCATAVAYVHGIASNLFGEGSSQALLFPIVAASIGAVILSFSIDYFISFPMRDLAIALRSQWGQKKELPPISSMPRDLAILVESFQEILSDIKKNMTTFSELQKLDEAKYEFVVIANHQLRTPLTEIKWASENLKTIPNIQTAAEAKLLVEKIDHGLDRITQIMDQFLAVVELSSNVSSQEHLSADILRLSHSVIDQIAPVAQKKEMDMALHVDDNFIPLVAGDPRLVGFVVETLVANAVVYGNSGTHIGLSMVNQNGVVEFSIDNVSAPMTPEEAAFLFEKFFRGEEARHIRPDGSGLALYLCKRIVERYGGTISAKLEGNNHFYFNFTLPLESKGEMAKFVTAY